jgi:hypothetical protein
MYIFHSPIHISTLLFSEMNSDVLKHLFFDIKILVLGLNPDDYFFDILSGLFDASHLVNIGSELAQLLLHHLNGFASRGFTKNILEVFILRDTEITHPLSTNETGCVQWKKPALP